MIAVLGILATIVLVAALFITPGRKTFNIPPEDMTGELADSQSADASAF